MPEPETTVIKAVTPQLEWLLRCSDNDNNLSTCAISVNDGEIDIYGPELDRISLERSQIAAFHSALHEAITLAETDLQARRRDRAGAGYQA